jgi:hypothetical protein
MLRRSTAIAVSAQRFGVNAAMASAPQGPWAYDFAHCPN